MIPTILYYILLFILVIIVNLFKQLKEFKIQDPSTPTPVKFQWKRVFFVSNEFIYTASGVYITLLQSQKDWIPPIVAALLLVALIGTNLDSMHDKFTDNLKFRLHIFIIIIVVLSTIATYVFHLDGTVDPKNCKKDAIIAKDSIKEYVVVIPYFDKTLNKRIGLETMGEHSLNYRTTVKAVDQASARKIAIQNFWTDTLNQPIILYKEKATKKTLLKIDESGIVIGNGIHN